SVLLAGGTQMAAVLSIIKHIRTGLDGLHIATTRYVLDDPYSSMRDLVSAVDPEIPILACDPHLDASSKPGLQAFSHGFVKEGVGAGGACTAAILKSAGKFDGYSLLREIEKEYDQHIALAQRANPSE